MIERMLQINKGGKTLSEALGLDKDKMVKETGKVAREMIIHPKVHDVMQFIWSNNDLTLEEQVFLTFALGKLAANPLMIVKAALGVDGKECNCDECKKDREEGR